MSDLWELFANLPLPQEHAGELFEGLEVPERVSDFLGKSRGASPAFLIRTDQAEVSRVPISLRHLRISFDVVCKIRKADGSLQEGTFCLIECISGSSDIQRCFVLVVGTLVSRLAQVPTRTEVLECLNDIAEAFRAMERPSGRTVAGLWGELWVLQSAIDQSALIDAWHGDGAEKFDFSIEKNRLEVKTTNSSLRVHEFASDQLRGADDVEICVCSLVLQKNTNGISVVALIKRIADRLSADSPRLAKLWTVVLGTLGENWEEAESIRFDESFARQNVLLMEAASIPVPIVPADAPISDVRFRISLKTYNVRDFDVPAVVFWRARLNI